MRDTFSSFLKAIQRGERQKKAEQARIVAWRLRILQQQERFDEFIGVYNNERPHQALGGAYPGDLYTPSARVY